MIKLLLFNLILIVIITVILVICKKYCKTEKIKYIALLIASILTILCHYSSIIYHYFLDKAHIQFLESNPNLILPIYPCNVVMWSCLVLGLIKDKKTKVGSFLIDYIFWFGLISSLVGMIVNIDFINNPTLLDYDVTKGIVAHAFLLLNVLLLPVFGYIKIDLIKNMTHILVSILLMFVIGCYCNLVFFILTTKEYAYHINSMFILHSPFENLAFLTYPFIALIAFILYFVIFHICELITLKPNERWYKRIKLKK